MAVEFKKTDEFYQFTHISPKKNKYVGFVPCSVFPQLQPDFWQGHEKFTSTLVNQNPSISYEQIYINDIFGWVTKLQYNQLIVYDNTSGNKRVAQYNIYLFPEKAKKQPFIQHSVGWI